MSRFHSVKLPSALLMLVFVCCCATAVHAQTLRIKLINGKNGQPIANKGVNVWVGVARKQAMAIPTDKDGIATLRLTNNDAEINIQTSNGSVINPVVKYSDTLRVNVGFVSCQPHTPDYSWLSVQTFSTAEVLRSGVVTTNVCGKAKASPEPGELILFVRPLTWWEAMKT